MFVNSDGKLVMTANSVWIVTGIKVLVPHPVDEYATTQEERLRFVTEIF